MSPVPDPDVRAVTVRDEPRSCGLLTVPCRVGRQSGADPGATIGAVRTLGLRPQAWSSMASSAADSIGLSDRRCPRLATWPTTCTRWHARRRTSWRRGLVADPPARSARPGVTASRGELCFSVRHEGPPSKMGCVATPIPEERPLICQQPDWELHLERYFEPGGRHLAAVAVEAVLAEPVDPRQRRKFKFIDAVLRPRRIRSGGVLRLIKAVVVSASAL